MIDFKNAALIKLSPVDPEKVMNKVMPLLIEGESILGVFKAIRDFVVFTNKRAISVNVQGITGSKKDFTSLPYSKVSVFSVETAGTFDLESELELYYSGVGQVRYEFSRGSDILAIAKCIATYAL